MFETVREGFQLASPEIPKEKKFTVRLALTTYIGRIALYVFRR